MAFRSFKSKFKFDQRGVLVCLVPSSRTARSNCLSLFSIIKHQWGKLTQRFELLWRTVDQALESYCSEAQVSSFGISVTHRCTLTEHVSPLLLFPLCACFGLFIHVIHVMRSINFQWEAMKVHQLMKGIREGHIVVNPKKKVEEDSYGIWKDDDDIPEK